MTKKTKTIKVGGGAEYAKVADRIKMFREDCPRGDIDTIPTDLPNGEVRFKAIVIKDKNDDTSAKASAHAQGTNKGVKAFEKIESIAVGRALAMLGYCADGEIATSEEMEDFMEFQQTKKQELVFDLMNKVDDIKSLDELRKFYSEHKGLGKELDECITKKSKELKNEDTQ